VWDEKEGGNLLALCTVPPVLVRTGDVPTIAEGALMIQIEPAVADDEGDWLDFT
jgi:hypothetical protein